MSHSIHPEAEAEFEAAAEFYSESEEGLGDDGIVQNKYSNDPGKLAAWLSAKHL